MGKKEYSIGVIKKISIEKGYGLVNDGKEEKNFIFGNSNLAEGFKLEDLKVGNYAYFVPNEVDDTKRYANNVNLVLSENESFKGKIRSLNKLDKKGRKYKHIFSESFEKTFILYSNFSINYLDGLNFEGLTNDQEIFFKLKVIKGKNGYVLSVAEISKSNETPKITGNNLIEKTSNEIIDVLKRNLDEIKKGETFEDYCALVLNLLGVELYQYSRKKQAGRADGIIKTYELDILYDCTLREDFEDYKEMQIDNYVSQINQNTVRVEKMEIALKEPKKQVWIITKGGNSKTRSIKEKERVKIKEINIENLIELLSSKITNPRVDISDKLGRLGDME